MQKLAQFAPLVENYTPSFILQTLQKHNIPTSKALGWITLFVTGVFSIGTVVCVRRVLRGSVKAKKLDLKPPASKTTPPADPSRQTRNLGSRDRRSLSPSDSPDSFIPFPSSSLNNNSSGPPFPFATGFPRRESGNPADLFADNVDPFSFFSNFQRPISRLGTESNADRSRSSEQRDAAACADIFEALLSLEILKLFLMLYRLEEAGLRGRGVSGNMNSVVCSCPHSSHRQLPELEDHFSQPGSHPGVRNSGNQISLDMFVIFPDTPHFIAIQDVFNQNIPSATAPSFYRSAGTNRRHLRQIPRDRLLSEDRVLSQVFTRYTETASSAGPVFRQRERSERRGDGWTHTPQSHSIPFRRRLESFTRSPLDYRIPGSVLSTFEQVSARRRELQVQNGNVRLTPQE